MIRAVIEVELNYPYKRSFTTLLEFCKVWKCQIRSGGTMKLRNSFFIEISKFKKIFKTNPQISEYEVPKGMEKFISSIKVTKVEVK